MKKIIALLLALCLLCACQKGPDAAQVGEALCRLYIAGDTAVTEVLGDIDAEQIREEMREALHQQLKNNLENIGVAELNESALNTVTEEMMSARSRIPVTVEGTKKEKETATVSITVGSIDLSAIDAKAAEQALSTMNDAAEDSEAYRQQLLEAYLEALQDGFVGFDGSGEKSTIRVELVKTKGLWLPADMQSFIAELGKAIRR